MKKSRISGLTTRLLRATLPICSLLLALLGSTFFLVGCGFDWKSLSTIQIKQMEYVETENTTITDINLDFDSTDFAICFDEQAEGISISYPQRQNRKGENISEITITETENSLTITEKKKNYFSLFDFIDPLATVTIPSSRVCALTIAGSTGDVIVNDGGVFSNFTVEISTGDIALSNIQAETLKTTLSTGDVTINGATVTGDMFVKASTGDISLSQVTANSLTAKASTGNVRVSDATLSEILQITTSTGNITCNENIRTQKLSITANTGSFKAKDALIDSQDISISINTGDVKATLVGSKHDYATTIDTNTGDKNISSNLEYIRDELINPDRQLNVETDTGDIKIYFADAN